jgi:hypothetical protein
MSLNFPNSSKERIYIKYQEVEQKILPEVLQSQLSFLNSRQGSKSGVVHIRERLAVLIFYSYTFCVNIDEYLNYAQANWNKWEFWSYNNNKLQSKLYKPDSIQ